MFVAKHRKVLHTLISDELLRMIAEKSDKHRH